MDANERIGTGRGRTQRGRSAARVGWRTLVVALAACPAVQAAGPQGTGPGGAETIERELRLEPVGAPLAAARLVVEGGLPGSAGLLVVRGAAGFAVQAIVLDADGRWERSLYGPRLAGVREVRFVGREVAGAAASVGFKDLRRFRRPPASSWSPVGSPGIVITEIMKDPTFVSDTSGEWFEVLNAGTQAVDLEGWTLQDLGSDHHVIDQGGAGLVVGPGQRLVLGNQDDPNLNGGVAVDYRYTGFTLSNGADEVVLRDAGGALVDQVAFDNGVSWPDTPGAALCLSPGVTSAKANDDPAHWCDATSPINLVNPDQGTPGAVNDACP